MPNPLHEGLTPEEQLKQFATILAAGGLWERARRRAEDLARLDTELVGRIRDRPFLPVRCRCRPPPSARG